jgi:hypothetical protein
MSSTDSSTLAAIAFCRATTRDRRCAPLHIPRFPSEFGSVLLPPGSSLLQISSLRSAMVRFYSSCNGAYSPPESAVPGRSCISPWLHRDYWSMPYWYDTISESLDLGPSILCLVRDTGTQFRPEVHCTGTEHLGSSLLSSSLTPAYATVIPVRNRMVTVSENVTSLIRRPV